MKKELIKLLESPSEPLFEIVRPEAVRGLTEAATQVPWYGQLMTVPQTMAYMLQLNYWLRTYGVEVVG